MNDKRLYYLAGPYSHIDQYEREARFRAVCDVAGYLMSKGVHVWSPIAHSHPIACQVDLPKGFDYWCEHNFLTLSRCDGMIVAMMPGWRESTGVSAEMEKANALGLPVLFLDYENYVEWIDEWLEGGNGL